MNANVGTLKRARVAALVSLIIDGGKVHASLAPAAGQPRAVP